MLSVLLCLSLYVVCFAVSKSIRMSVLLCRSLYVVCFAVSESIRMSVLLCRSLRLLLSFYRCVRGYVPPD